MSDLVRSQSPSAEEHATPAESSQQAIRKKPQRDHESDDAPHKKPRKSSSSTPGIVYVSRVPPGMTPQKVKHLMERWGEVGRIYAQKKDAPPATASKASQKAAKKRHEKAMYTEAWVEFLDKKMAKVVAEMLNAQVIGGKKGDRWRDDVWTMKYLSGFKWEMLGEQIAYERQAHSARLRQELSKSKTEQNEYLKNVELARVLEKRRVKKAEQQPQQGYTATSASAAAVGDEDKAKRKYKQRELVDRRKPGGGGTVSGGSGGGSMGNVLDHVF